MRVQYFGTFHSSYPGNTLLIQGLRESGVTVDICHVPVGESTRSKYHRYKSSLSRILLAGEYFVAYLKLFFKYFSMPDHDAIIIGYWGQMDAPLAWILARLRRKPLVFNPMMSLYDVVVIDRRLFNPRSLPAMIIRWLDRTAFALSDIVLLDSDSHIGVWRDVLGCDETKVRRLFVVSADPGMFFPRSHSVEESPFRVLFYGTYTPAQGVPVIVQAAKLLEDEGVEFEIIGFGQETEKVEKLRSSLKPGNIRFVDWVDFDRLPDHISSSHAGLGMFGAGDKVNRNFPYKVVQCMAMGMPVITGDSTSIRELWTDRENILLCRPADPDALAEAIRTLKKDAALRERIGQGGLQLFRDKLTPSVIGQGARAYLEEIVR